MRLVTALRLTPVWFVLLILVASAQAQQSNAHALIAALNYNFAKYADWPSADENRSIQLCYFSDALRDSFGALQNKLIFDKPVKIRQLTDIEPATNCQLVYIDHSERAILKRLFVHLDNQPVLTVSDITGFTDSGGMIEIVQVDNKYRFKVNLSRMQRSDLAMSSQVLKLALEVK